MELSVKTVGVIVLLAATCAVFGATPLFVVAFALAPGPYPMLGLVPAASIILVWVFLIGYLRRLDRQKVQKSTSPD
jgi:hypothetical protein